MPKLLVVDNSPFGASFLIDRFQVIPGLEVHQRSSENAALTLAEAEAFDFYFIDLKLDDDQSRNYNGIQLGAKLRKRSEESVFVMYSSDIPDDNPSQFSQYKRCLSAGADDVVSRDWLYNQLPDELEKYLNGLAEKRTRKRSEDRPVRFVDTWRTLASRELISDVALESLIRKTIPFGESHEVEAIKGGYSGAVLFRVRSVTSEGSEELRNIVKVSKSRSALEDEFRRRPAIGSHMDSVAETPYGRAVVYDRDWAAMPIREVTGAPELSDMLRERELPAATHQIYEKVADILVSAARDSRMVRARGNRSEPLFKYQFGAELLDILDALSKMVAILSVTDQHRINSVRSFIERALQGHWAPDAAYEGNFALLHGDFHTRNLLVTNQSSVIVIDLARRGFYPRLFDFASFDVDLVLTHIGARDGSDWSFEQVDEWEALVSTSYPFHPSLVRSGTSEPEVFLREYLLSQMLAEINHVSRREYTDALIFQLLRHIRFPTIPRPKKVLAIRLVSLLLDASGLT